MKVLFSENISLHKIHNPQLKLFLEKYMSREISSDSTLCKLYVKSTYKETIREKVRRNKIWALIDEPTDSEERLVVNVIIGTLKTDALEKFICCQLKFSKNKFFNDCKTFWLLFVLWPDGIRHNVVLLFITDAAPTMVKARRSLQYCHSKMIHLTCLVHGIHKFAENVRENLKKWIHLFKGLNRYI